MKNINGLIPVMRIKGGAMFNNKDRDMFYKAMDKAESVGRLVGDFINKKTSFVFKGFLVCVCIAIFGGILLLISTLRNSVGKK